MPRAYSTDFRLRVLDFIAEGRTQLEAQKTFNIALSTIREWMKMKRETGNVIPKKTGSPGKRKMDYDALKKYVEDNPSATLHEIAREFKVWPSAIEKALNTMDITRKKNDALQRSLPRKTRGLSGGNR